MLTTWARFVTRRAWPVLAGVTLATLLALVALVDVRALAEGRWLEVPRLTIDPSQSSVLPRESEDRAYYDRIRRIFGSDDALLLAIHRPEGVFEPETLDAIRRLTRRLEELPYVRSVMSLSNTPDIRGEGDDLLVAPLYEGRPEDQAEADAVRAHLARNPVLSGSLASEDGTTALVVVSLLEVSDLEFTLQGFDRQVLAAARDALGDRAEVHLSGGPHIQAETSRILIRDLATVVPAAALVLMVVAFLSFRTARGVVIPLLTVGIAVAWLMGFASLVVPHLNVVTSSVPAILLGIGFAYAIHVVSAYYEAVRDAGREGGADEGRTAAATAIREVGVPTLLTGLTTAVGFASLATSPLSAIREFGLLASLGVASVMVACLTFAPALLAVLPAKAPPGSSRDGDRIDRLLAGLGRFDLRHRRGILVAGAALALLSVAAIPRIQVSTNLVDNFPRGHPVRASIEAMNDLLGTSDQVYVVLETDYRNAFKEPVNLDEVARLDAWLEEQPEVGSVASVADYVKLIHRGFHGNRPEEYRIPDSKGMVSQLLLFGASNETRRLVDSQYQITTLQVRIRAVNSAEVVNFADRVERRLAALPPHLRGRITGSSVLVARTNDDIAFGQALSLTTAFVIIYAILALLFASFWIGLVAMVPNVLPVLIYFGTLGWFGITLNVTTGLVACLVLGIAVDDTIHLMARFSALARERADEESGIREALRQVGRPVTYTSIALCLGFLAISRSTLQQQVEFGALAAFTLAVAWVVDLTFTPALMGGMRIVTLWEVLSLDLGEDPSRAIPLFRGLSTRQARIAALMTQIVELPAGDRLIRAGDRASDMYVVIDGELRSHVEREGRDVPLNVHRRGDVIGEVAMFTGERTAHVDCVTDVRALRLDQDNLERLRRRYPRIGAEVFRNLSEILAGRLVGLTARVR